MRLVRLKPINQQSDTSGPAKRHRSYPYLLRGLRVDCPNQVWCSHITNLPMRRGLLHLVAIMVWHTRKLGQPEIFDTDSHTMGASLHPSSGRTDCADPASASQWTGRAGSLRRMTLSSPFLHPFPVGLGLGGFSRQASTIGISKTCALATRSISQWRIFLVQSSRAGPGLLPCSLGASARSTSLRIFIDTKAGRAQRNGSTLTRNVQIRVAILRAVATAAAWAPLRSLMRRKNAREGPTALATDQAASTSIVRAVTLPCLVMRPWIALRSPDCRTRGVRPT